MAAFKCKMCGGNLEVAEGSRVCVCESCGTKQTLPRLEDERRRNLYDRANHFRRNNEFDKAMAIYETVLNEDSTDAEAYWSLILCKYGIEYVEDSATRKRVLTCNRTQYTSVFADADYKSALEHADGEARALYQEEAAEIDRIQKGILDISSKEEPFDVFICYKETDNAGRRTPDSVLAQDLYFQLKEEGYKVFFSRITLEDKLGSAYEPYIFAALNSAKVMVVVTTRPEYVDSPWVKNEWGRYLAIIKSNPKKVLIPAYRDMDPYGLPEEFSHLQAQDMSKLGFMQDLVRGIQKIVAEDGPKASSVPAAAPVGVAAVNTSALLKRAYLCLEDGEFERADEFVEEVLNQDPENGEGYLVKLMVEQRVVTPEGLALLDAPFSQSKNYQKIMRFGSKELMEQVQQYEAAVQQRRRDLEEEARKEAQYLRAQGHATSRNPRLLALAADLFEELQDYKDSREKSLECHGRREQICREQESFLSVQSRKAEELRALEASARRNREESEAENALRQRKQRTRNAIMIPCIIGGSVFLFGWFVFLVSII